MGVAVKICGINSRAALDAAIGAGADMCGFVLFPPSPRHLDPETAASFIGALPERVRSVVLTVDADDALLDVVARRVRPDLVQAHGRESPARVAAIAARAGRPVIKALPVSARADLAAAKPYAAVAEMLLFDARPPKGADRPGGFGHAFDWQILSGHAAPLPWLLAGGLAPGNVAEAIRITGARAVDVSSGVEARTGVKDPGLIRDFVAAARAAASGATAAGTEHQEERA